ncbi:MAG: carbohydrate kinase family protein, partial [Spirochaetales bacterium]|nr:carbohydrate kinase family protein [Spirochaetales bacterium]
EMKEEEFADMIMGEFDLDIVCVTFGADGAGIMTEEGWSRVPGEISNVIDTVGAGNSFSAEFLHSLYVGYTPEESAQRACVMGAYVSSSAGAVPIYSDELKEMLSIG